jgi:hypothetical protein
LAFNQFSTVFADFNNDGRLDVLLSGGSLLLEAPGTSTPQFQAPVSTSHLRYRDRRF